MQMEQLIAAHEFCASHDIEISFINALQDFGLIEFTTIQETEFIHTDQLQQLEQILRLHYELDINLEGIETITHLLQRINSMQDEITMLKNRLRLYEDNDL